MDEEDHGSAVHRSTTCFERTCNATTTKGSGKWSLVRVRAYFFLNEGGSSAVSPFISLIAKNIGFTTSVVGIVNTLTVAVALIAKPLAGALSDRYGHHKLLWLLCYILSLCCTFSVIFIPRLPETTPPQSILSDNNVTVYVSTEEGSHVKICHKWVIGKMLREKKSPLPCIANCLLTFSPRTMCKSLQDCSVFVRWLGTDYANKLSLTKTDDAHTNLLSINFLLHMERASSSSSVQDQNHSCQVLLINNIAIGSHEFIHFPSSNLEFLCNLECSTTGKKRSVGDALSHEAPHGSRSLSCSYQLWWYAFVVIIGGVSKRVVEVIQTSVVYALLGERYALYGKLKMYGSLGFGFALLVGGLLSELYKPRRTVVATEYAWGFYIYALFIILATGLIGSFRVLPQPRPKQMMNTIAGIFLQFQVLVFFAAAFFAGTCSSLSSTYSFWFLTEKGVTPLFLGLSKGAQCLFTEIPCLYFSGWLIKKIGHIQVITIAFAVLALKFLTYSLMNTIWVVFATEPLEGIFYGLLYPAATSYINTIAPAGMKTVMQGLFFTTFKGAGRMVGNLAGGLIYDKYGGQTTFLMSTITCGACCFLLLLLHIGTRQHKCGTIVISHVT